MKKTLFPLLSMAVLLSCATGAPPADTETAESPPSPKPASVTDAEIGLAPGTAFEQPPQAPIAFNRSDPGDSNLRPRPNEEFPPAIPHSIEGLETITLAENSCLECHDPVVAPNMGAPAVPVTHQVDLRRSPEDVGEEMVGARWVCTSCHVDQTETEPLVANSIHR